jgi:hypothetical protein
MQNTSQCGNERFALDWETSKCTQVDDDVFQMKCLVDGDTSIENCGARMSSREGRGAGTYSANIIAAPEDGVATTLYLSTLGWSKNRNEAWIEADWEILGKMIGSGETQVWTNVFLGVGINAPHFVRLPFDVSAAYHQYAIEVGCCTLKYLVDGVVYRTDDIGYFPDFRQTTNQSNVQLLASVWGNNLSHGNGWGDMGNLEDNPLQDLVASYRDMTLPNLAGICRTRPRGRLAATKLGYDGWEVFSSSQTYLADMAVGMSRTGSLKTAFELTVWESLQGVFVGGDVPARQCSREFTFTMVSASQVTVRACNGEYLTVKAGGSVTSEVAGSSLACQRFEIGNARPAKFVGQRPGSFFLKTCLGTYLTEARQDSCEL